MSFGIYEKIISQEPLGDICTKSIIKTENKVVHQQ